MFKVVRVGLVGLVMTVIISATVIHASTNRSTISKFVVSGVEYQQAADPIRPESVEFDLDRAAGTVHVKLVSSDPTFIACQNTSSFQWYCLFPKTIPLFSLDELRVLALGEQRPDHRQGE